tara:strand:- start:143 stop:1312 length:1170 start_codon:yes stop_codon:yes gene_type:complete
MEPYILSAEDIAKLQAANISSAFDAEPGMEAAENEIEFLNGPSTAPMAERLEAPEVLPADVGPNIPLLPASAVAAPASAAPAPSQNNMALIQQLLAAQTANSVPKDPYESLSKTQRRMLAFAGLSDAGAALQGRQGVSINNMMSRFNEQADMQRKAAGAQAQQKMMQGLMGGAGGMGGGSVEDQRKQAMALLLNPATVEYGKSMLAALDAAAKKGSGEELRGRSAVSTLRDIDSIIGMIDEDPTMTTGVWAWATRGIANTPAGKTDALVQSVVSSLALDSLKALKATGATMGALNQSELEILKTELAKVDLAAGAEATKRQLGKVQGHYRTVISDMYRGASDEDAAKITMFLGLPERPSWAGGSSSSNAAPLSDADFIEQERKRREGND